MEYLLTNVTKPRHRKATFNGEEHIVVPLRMIVPGVLNGSKGPLLYKQDEIARNHTQWDGIPVTKYHPTDEVGNALSAQFPGVLEKQGMGIIRNPRIDKRGLKAEAWLNVKKTRRIAPEVLNAVLQNKPVEISTGLFTNNVPARNGANFNGRGYTHVAQDFKADHLAILPGMKGACSLDDGCGLLANTNRFATLGRGFSNNGWVTTDSGTHIFLGEGGEVTKGPKALRDKGKGGAKSKEEPDHIKAAKSRQEKFFQEEHGRPASSKAKPAGDFKNIGIPKKDKEQIAKLHDKGSGKSSAKPMTQFEDHSPSHVAAPAAKPSLWSKFKKLISGPHGLGFNQMTINEQKQLFTRFKQFLSLVGNEELLDNGGPGSGPHKGGGSNDEPKVVTVGKQLREIGGLTGGKVSVDGHPDAGKFYVTHPNKTGEELRAMAEKAGFKVTKHDTHKGTLGNTGIAEFTHNSQMSDFMECEEDCDDEDCIDECLDDLSGNSEQVDNGGPGSGPHKGGGSASKEARQASTKANKLSNKLGALGDNYTAGQKASTKEDHHEAKKYHIESAREHKEAGQLYKKDGDIAESKSHFQAASLHSQAAKLHSSAKGLATNQDKDQTTGKFLHLGAGNGKGEVHEAAKTGHATIRGDIVTPEPDEEELPVADPEDKEVLNGGPGSGPHRGGGNESHEQLYSRLEKEGHRVSVWKNDPSGLKSYAEATKGNKSESSGQKVERLAKKKLDIEHERRTGSMKTINGRSGLNSVRNHQGEPDMAKLSPEDREQVITNLCTNCDCEKANIFNEEDRDLLENFDDDKLLAFATQRDELAMNANVVSAVRKKFKFSDKITVNAMPAALAKAAPAPARGAPAQQAPVEESTEEANPDEVQEDNPEGGTVKPAQNQSRLTKEEKSVLNWAKRERNQRRDEIIEKLTENLDEEQSELLVNKLSTMELEDLETFAVLAPKPVRNTQRQPQQLTYGGGGYGSSNTGKRPPIFQGAGVGRQTQTHNAEEDDAAGDILEMPTVNWAEESPMFKKLNKNNSN